MLNRRPDMRKIIDTPDYTVTTNDPALVRASKERLDELFNEANAEGRAVSIIMDGESLSADQIKEMFVEFFLARNEAIDKLNGVDPEVDPQVAAINRMDTINTRALAAAMFYAMHMAAFTVKEHKDTFTNGNLETMTLVIRGLVMDLMSGFDSMCGMNVPEDLVYSIRDSIYIALDRFIKHVIPGYVSVEQDENTGPIVESIIMLMDEFSTKVQLLEHVIIEPMTGHTQMNAGMEYFSTLAGKLYSTMELTSNASN
jgi:hypothetical protein